MKKLSFLLCVLLCAYWLCGCAPSIDPMVPSSSGDAVQIVHGGSATGAKTLKVYLPKNEELKEKVMAVLNAYAESFGTQIKPVERLTEATLAYVADYGEFDSIGGEKMLINLDTMPSESRSLNSLLQSIDEEYKLTGESGANFGVPMGLEGYGYMVDTKLLADLFSLENAEGLLADLQNADYNQWKSFVNTIAQYIRKPSAKAVTLGENTYTMAAAVPDSAQRLSGVFALATGEEAAYTSFALNSAFNYAFSDKISYFKKTDEDIARLKIGIGAYAESLDTETANLAQVGREITRGDGFANEPQYTGAEALSIFADGCALFIRADGHSALQVAVKNPSLKNHLAFVPIKIAADHEVNTRLTVKSYGYWGISSLANSKERETAVDFIVWLNVSNKGKEYIHTGFGLIDISSKQYSTSIMGSTMGYIKSGSTVPYIADYANSNIAASLGRLCKKQMSTAKWGESFYNAFADAAENYL